MYHTCTHICITKRIHCIHLNQEGFVVLNILYLALHAIYCVMAVRLIRNYEITTEDDYYARNSVFLLASRLREMEKKSKSCSLTWHFTKHCSIRHKQNAGTRIRFRLLSATDRDEQVAGRRDFNKPEAHCVRVLERTDEGYREKEDGCYNEALQRRSSRVKRTWRISALRAVLLSRYVLIMTSTYIPSFIYNEFATRRQNIEKILYFLLINVWASSLFFHDIFLIHF